MPEVKLIHCMGDDLHVVNSARVSMDKNSDWVFDDDGGCTLKEKDARLIRYLAEHNHHTPFAHPQVCFRVTAPIYVARQLFKHKVGGVENEISRRYVDTSPTLDVPKQWRKRAANVKQGSSEELASVGETLLARVDACMQETMDVYTALLDAGVCPEQARCVLPQCMETSWVWTGSLLFWARVCRLRLDSHAQKETRDVARQIDRLMAAVFPISWKELLR